MSWVTNSQETVVHLADVFRSIIVTGSHNLTKLEFYQGLADNFGSDMGFSELEWESMFELMETNADDTFNFHAFVFGIAAYQRSINQNKIQEIF